MGRTSRRPSPKGEIRVWIPAGGYVDGEIITGAHPLGKPGERTASVRAGSQDAPVFEVEAVSPPTGGGGPGRPYTVQVTVHFQPTTSGGVTGSTFNVTKNKGSEVEDGTPAPFIPNP